MSKPAEYVLRSGFNAEFGFAVWELWKELDGPPKKIQSFRTPIGLNNLDSLCGKYDVIHIVNMTPQETRLFVELEESEYCRKAQKEAKAYVMAKSPSSDAISLRYALFDDSGNVLQG